MPPHVNVHVEMIMSALKMKLSMLSKSARCNRGLRTGAAGRFALAAERPILVGIVSHTYSLAPHREVASLCRNGLVDAGIEPSDLRYEVGLSELGEWMNFRIYLPDSYNFVDAHGDPLGLRLECFNSVDASTRLVVLFGWLRFVCANGLIIGETKIEMRERHGKGLNHDSISKRIQPALEAVVGDRSSM